MCCDLSSAFGLVGCLGSQLAFSEIDERITYAFIHISSHHDTYPCSFELVKWDPILGRTLYGGRSLGWLLRLFKCLKRFGCLYRFPEGL